jgi:S-DNA-T family DNA segregation ATPase FtsK/SpoIIIE
MCLKIDQMKVKIELNIPLGVNENGEQEFLDLNKARHVLIAGKTGSGKSIFLHKIIKHLTENYSKDEVRLFLIDLKQTAFLRYKDYVIYDLEQAKSVLNDLVNKIKAEVEKEEIPTIIIVDECCELLFDCETLSLLKTIAAKGRAVNAHLILSTQMFAPDVLVQELKANLQTRVCFPVADIDDSFLIVHEEGAEKLKTGEFLYKSPNSDKGRKLKTKKF